MAQISFLLVQGARSDCFSVLSQPQTYNVQLFNTSSKKIIQLGYYYDGSCEKLLDYNFLFVEKLMNFFLLTYFHYFFSEKNL